MLTRRIKIEDVKQNSRHHDLKEENHVRELNIHKIILKWTLDTSAKSVHDLRANFCKGTNELLTH
jgi:hypothetical protein